jgi:hypothetical protein
MLSISSTAKLNAVTTAVDGMLKISLRISSHMSYCRSCFNQKPNLDRRALFFPLKFFHRMASQSEISNREILRLRWQKNWFAFSRLLIWVVRE